MNVRKSRSIVAGALTAAVCVFGLTATADAAGKGRAKRAQNPRFTVSGLETPAYLGRKPSDHPKLDRKLNDRADIGGIGRTRAIVVLKAGCSVDADVSKAGGKNGRRFGVISGQLVELPNNQLRKLANNACVAAIHWDRKTGGEMNYAAIVEGARQVQQLLGYDGAGVGVALVDSGITSWHDDLTYYGHNSAVKTVGGQRVVKFVDFVNGQTGKYDDNGHGTHVAGIIAGTLEGDNSVKAVGRRWSEDGTTELLPEVHDSISGMAPKCTIVSMKVLDKDGNGRTSAVIQALERVQEINGYGRRVLIHGVNLSVGYDFEPEWFACGQSPLCVEVDRLVRSGVVVVVAAGNTGYGVQSTEARGNVASGLPLSINDPGNAELAITVGSTHRDMPHTYGVSYFSSKGPTGDGRAKPDLLAPGEKVLSCAAGAMRSEALSEMPDAEFDYLEQSGTSMAAPHVSGVIAAFLSVRREFIGQPEKVKAIFINSATDLNRDRYFQGSGLVDLMRAIQSV
jgi:subtilisin family serine protease